MIAWLRFSVACSLTLVASMAHAEIKVLCTIGGEPPRIITVDKQAKTVDGLPNLQVFKVSDKAVWLIREKDEPEPGSPPDVKFTVISRSVDSAGALKTIIINESATVHDTAYPQGVCWEQKQKAQ